MLDTAARNSGNHFSRELEQYREAHTPEERLENAILACEVDRKALIKVIKAYESQPEKQWEIPTLREALRVREAKLRELTEIRARLQSQHAAQPQNVRPTPKSVATPHTAPAAKRSAESVDARPGQSSKMPTAARQPAKTASQPLRDIPVARQQPVKAAPAVSQGTFKISPAEMTKRVNAEADKLILEGARQHVELKCSTPQNQTAQEMKKREQVVLEAANTAKKLLQKPEHSQTLTILTRAATANVKFALGVPEDDFQKDKRGRDNESAIGRVCRHVLNNERVESVVASSISGLRRR